MLTNNKWIPEISRPTLNGDDFELFLQEWVKENYAEEFAEAVAEEKEFGDETLGITEFVLYQNILEHWQGDDGEAAERLIKYENWSFQEAQEFVHKSLEYDARRHEEKIQAEWIAQNGYTLPFPVGSRVKWRGEIGEVQADKDNRYLPLGKICVLTEEQMAQNKRWEQEGNSSRNGGWVIKWEDLELVAEKDETAK
ncbi:hypothetical protein L5B97_00415 [Avibacterium sp. 20-15]|uniref:hypothetical protein n=1 Tax=unclassified Avibacterium TaxID=2685287 RepID=UPI002026A92F|nr:MULTISPECIES: hypothetical protein [unclassified Avibacterium]MCW9731964.1 hypothetical protein [Avibacterium sp. 20-15]URL04153.1 hypothetical protein L4F93_11495 [Avibacterium sp. 20-132]